MNLHEFQAKALLGRYGVAVPEGWVVSSVDEIAHVVPDSPQSHWVVKAQVHAGGRGKAGGVRRVQGQAGVLQAAGDLLGSHLLTAQGTGIGQPVNQVSIEAACEIARELYLGVVVDRKRERVVFMASSAGGMDIEEVAAQAPERIMRVVVDPLAGLQAYQCRQFAFALDLSGQQVQLLTSIMQGMYRLFMEKDASLLEINPLVVTDAGGLLALDAKLVLDENALYRQKSLAELHDTSQEDAREAEARRCGLNYVHLDGSIGCMVNGAGLAMATMDLIQLHGGSPANFLDVGGGTNADKVASAFKLILSSAQVKVILVNIFGGIVRCDLIAEGIIKAVREVGIHVPVVVRLAGTNARQGQELLAASGLQILAVDELSAAAEQAVRAAGGR